MKSVQGALGNQLIDRSKMEGSDPAELIEMGREVVMQAGYRVIEKNPACLSGTYSATQSVKAGAPAVEGLILECGR